MKNLFLLTLFMSLIFISCTAPNEPVIDKKTIKEIKVLESYYQTALINDIADDDQYIWCATEQGVVRINKLTNEKKLYDQNSIPFGNYTISKVIVNKDNTVYAVFSNTIYYKLQNSETWLQLSTPDDFYNSGILDIVVDQQNRLWVINKNKIYQYSNNNWSKLESTANVITMTLDKNDNLWFCDRDSLNYLKKYDGHQISEYHLPDTYIKANLRGIAIDKDLNTVITTDYKGIAYYNQNSWQVFDYNNSNLPPNYLHRVEVDNDNNYWIFYGIYGSEIIKFNNGVITTYDEYSSPFKNINFKSLHADRSGRMLFGAYESQDKQNLLIYSNNTWLKSSCMLYPSPTNISEMLTDKNGNVWLAGNNGITKITNGNWQFYFPEDTVNNVSGLDDINSMVEDASGNIWFGTDGGVIKYDGIKFEYFTSYNSPFSFAQKCIVGLNGYSKITVVDQKFLYIYDGKKWSNGIYCENVNSICGDWLTIDSYAYKIYSYEDKHLDYLRYDLSNSPLTKVLQMCTDNSGYQWFVTFKDGCGYVYQYRGSFYRYDWNNIGIPNYVTSSYIIKNDSKQGLAIFSVNLLSMKQNDDDWQPFMINWSSFNNYCLQNLTWQNNKTLLLYDGSKIYKAEVQE